MVRVAAMRGSVIAGRFLLERPAGAGGSGTVWLAREIRSGVHVALKLVLLQGASTVERFGREASLVSSLDHPGVARYVAHGVTAEGTLFLATEWIEGQTLSERLQDGSLSAAEAVVLGEALGGALGAIHERGIVHRDVKPRNVLLDGGDLARPKIVDFGIARARESSPITETGAVIGTPGYMAPEQVRGEPTDARADVFSLGCVLFRALTGGSAFGGEDTIAMLLRTTLEEPPPVHELRADVPVQLSDLIAGTLAKDRSLRPGDGAAVARALREVRLRSAVPAPPPREPAPSITGEEQRVASIVVALLDDGLQRVSDSSTPPTLPEVDVAAAAEVARAAVEPMHARVERLGTAALVVIPPELGAAGDEAVSAARCALALRSALPPPVRIACATGRGAGGGVPWGAVIDRATQAVRGASSEVALDTLTATLLRPRFRVIERAGRPVLVGERDGPPGTTYPPPREGRPGTFVGRERDLRALLLLAREAIDARDAGAAVVTAPAGMGKTRLASEVIARLQREGPITVWRAWGDPVLTPAPYGMLASLLRSAAGVAAGRETAMEEAKLRDLVASVAPDRAEAIAAPLTRVLQPSSRADPGAELRWGDQVAVGDRIRQAWTDLVARACEARPLLLVLDDAHHADRTTMDCVGHALRLLARAPLFVLALGRPEIDEVHAALWPHAGLTRLALRGLSPADAERLCHALLGEAASPRAVEGMVQKAAGNPFFLEELARNSMYSIGVEAPESVLAVLSSRIRRLPPLARRALRAASLFGERFQTPGVAALLDVAPAVVHAKLIELSGQDVLLCEPPGGPPHEAVFAFRHALLREAAGAMLTDDDRALGHRLAAAWLSGKASVPAQVIADHFERGGAYADAVRWYVRAAEAALEGNDFHAVIALGERAVARGAAGEELGAVRLCQAEAHRWRGENAAMEASANEAIALLPAGGAAWCQAVTLASTARGRLGHDERAVTLARRLLDAAGGRDPSRAWCRAAGRVVLHLHIAGTADAVEVAGALAAVIEAAPAAAGDPVIAGLLSEGRAERALKEGRPGRAVRLYEEVARAYLASDDARLAARAAISVGVGYRAVGSCELALDWLLRARQMCQRLGGPALTAAVDHALVSVLDALGRHDEARAAAERAISSYVASGNRRMEQATRIYLALVLVAEGRWEEAASEARAAAVPVAGAPGMRAHALAVLARIELARGEIAAATEASEEAFSLLAGAGGIEEGTALVCLARAECLSAAGDVAGARRILFQAERRILERAEGIEDPEQREDFLRRIPEHRTTLELVQAVRAASAEHAGAQF